MSKTRKMVTLLLFICYSSTTQDQKTIASQKQVYDMHTINTCDNKTLATAEERAFIASLICPFKGGLCNGLDCRNPDCQPVISNPLSFVEHPEVKRTIIKKERTDVPYLTYKKDRLRRSIRINKAKNCTGRIKNMYNHSNIVSKQLNATKPCINYLNKIKNDTNQNKIHNLSNINLKIEPIDIDDEKYQIEDFEKHSCEQVNQQNNKQINIKVDKQTVQYDTRKRIASKQNDELHSKRVKRLKICNNKTSFKKFYENKIAEINNKYVVNSLSEYRNGNTEKYYQNLINGCQKPEFFGVKVIFSILTESILFEEGKYRAIMSLFMEYKMNELVPFNIKLPNQSDFCKRKKPKTSKLEEFKAIINKNAMINELNYLDGDTMVSIHTIEHSKNIKLINFEYNNAIKHILRSKHPSKLNNPGLVNIYLVVPELIFYIEWIKAQHNTDIKPSKKLIIEEIKQLDKLVYLHSIYNNAKHCNLIEYIYYDEIEKLRKIMLKRMNEYAPKTMSVGLYELAIYYAHERGKDLECFRERSNVLFILAFTLEYDEIISAKVYELLGQYESKQVTDENLVQFLRNILSYKIASSKVILSLVLTISYLEGNIKDLEALRIYMIIPYQYYVAIIMREKYGTGIQCFVITSIRLVKLLYIRIEELLNLK